MLRGARFIAIRNQQRLRNCVVRIVEKWDIQVREIHCYSLERACSFLIEKASTTGEEKLSELYIAPSSNLKISLMKLADWVVFVSGQR